MKRYLVLRYWQGCTECAIGDSWISLGEHDAENELEAIRRASDGRPGRYAAVAVDDFHGHEARQTVTVE